MLSSEDIWSMIRDKARQAESPEVKMALAEILVEMLETPQSRLYKPGEVIWQDDVKPCEVTCNG